MKNRKIQEQLLIWFLIFTVIPLSVISFWCYLLASRIINQKSSSYAAESIQQLSDNLDQLLVQIENTSLSISYNNYIQNALENPDAGTNHPFSVERQMSYIYNSSALSEKNFTDSIYIYNNHNIIYHAYTSGILEHATASAPSPIWHATLKDSSLRIISGYPGNSFSSSALNSSAIASLFV